MEKQNPFAHVPVSTTPTGQGALVDIATTNESAVHWDMVCDLRGGGEIRVDGELLHRDGKFVVAF